MDAPTSPASLRVAVVGAGWAGLAAAVRCVERGHRVTLMEASHHWGGRARSLDAPLETLDNGQHILIGAYSSCLNLMERVGVAPQSVLQAVPLALRFPDGGGLAVPPWAVGWPTPFNILASILTARGWSWTDRLGLLRTTGQWQRQSFRCPEARTVADLCLPLPKRVVRELIEPLCLSALNTPLHRASASVFLRVLQDALLGTGWGPWRASDLLLPSAPLGELLPRAAVQWLERHGATLRLGHRVLDLQSAPASPGSNGWLLDGEPFDRVILACTSTEAARLCTTARATAAPEPALGTELERWARQSQGLAFEAIATVYTQSAHRLVQPNGQPTPLLALRDTPTAPAQFVFDRGQVGGPSGLVAFVVSANKHSLRDLEPLVLAQAEQALGWTHLRIVKTVVEKRATFACTPQLARPAAGIAPGLFGAGDYVAGPYPATLEGAVRSGEHAANNLNP
jgi:hydroxysqualene dehydroxylase